MKKKILGLFAKDQPQEKRFFNIIALGGMLSSFLGGVLAIFTGVTWQNTLWSFLSGFIIAAIFWMANHFERFQECAFGGLLFMNLIVMPLMYFKSGGIHSGMSIWFTFGIIAIFFTLKGKYFYIAIVTVLGGYMATYLISYLYPQCIVPARSEGASYMDIAASLVIATVVIGVLYRLQTQIYDEQKKTAEEQNRKLEEANRVKSRFLANMSHEIRTPINAMIASNEMILRDDVSEKVAENATNIAYAGEMLLSLINDVLDFSKLESDKMELIETPYDTERLFRELIHIHQVRAKEKKLDFKVQIDSALPAKLSGDNVRIKQLLTNILTNAIKYTPSGSVSVSVTQRDCTKEQTMLVVCVSDTGIGIREEELSMLFDSFHRVEELSNQGIEGSGLGLAISRQLAELMGGTIEVKSVYHKGSTFTISIPQQIVDSTPIGRIDFLAPKTASKEMYRWHIAVPKAQILVVDDNEMNLVVASRLLLSMEAQVDIAYSGKQCLGLTAQKKYDLIFMDHMMPEMDGIEALHRIKSQENGCCQKTPVIVLTANAVSGAREEYQTEGFTDYFVKPVNGKGFEAMLQKHLPPELIEQKNPV